MAGRFPIYVDADVHGPLVDGLIHAGWDVVRAIDAFRERTGDPVHFEHAVRTGRVLVSNDRHMRELGERWYAEGRRFPGLVWWHRRHYARMGVGEILEAFERIARRDDPFSAYPILAIGSER